MRKRVAILGASGYTGRELTRLVSAHPDLETPTLMTARAGVEPDAPESSFEPRIERLDLGRLGGFDGVFLCTPHGAAAPFARAALDAGCKVVDLSADFRLRDPAVHASAYGEDHDPGLRERAIYGLTEHARDAVRAADFVANPGCYPTSVSLPLLPLVHADLVDLSADVIADCKSGTSGAGKEPKRRTHFGNVHENFLAYGVGDHRHQPEIWQAVGSERVLFVPHLLPTFRGILSTIWLRPHRGVHAAEIRACLHASYDKEPFVRIYDKGFPELMNVQLTNFCDIAVADVPASRETPGRVVIVSVIDNLVKGASGQALQNMNLMLGLDETAGLLA
ncbi:MAG: N-acetyl-gamma-glutamyl-phosphate reductase [Planctomycetota bacterium]